MSDYNDHHYVPQWYQKRFMLPGQTNYFYLNLKPETFRDSKDNVYVADPLKEQGSKPSFFQKHLYTTKMNGINSKDIEQYFFGKIDNDGRDAVEYFTQYDYPPKDWKDFFDGIMNYMSTQKLRTPKGLTWLSNQIGDTNKDVVLDAMLRLRRIHCAIWTESVWQIADATESSTKFIVSDHPVTVYNRKCGPRSDWCKEENDPAIWLNGTHTIFPLSIDKVLIMTNLSWARNPYQSAIKNRPNPNPHRSAMFKFTDVQVRRKLSEEEVRQINFIIKSRAYKYIAAAKKDWLYPEKYISKSDWNSFGHGYLLMPDPRALHWGGEIIIGHKDGTVSGYDEYGRKPWDPDYSMETKTGSEHNSLQWFQGEFASLFGPHRRGRCMQAGRIEKEKDSEDHHKYHLSLQKRRFRDRK